MAVELLAERLRRLRAARGLSERELAQRIGMTVHQYQSATRAGANPTCALLVDLAEALDVSITDLTDLAIATRPSLDDMRAFRQELRWRRAAMIGGADQLGNVDRRLARLDEALGGDSEPSAAALDAAVALMRAIDRNEPVRAVASRYARLVLQRCAGRKGVASRVLGIQHQTLGKYLRYPVDDDSRRMQVAEATHGSGRIVQRLEEDRAAAPVTK